MEEFNIDHVTQGKLLFPLYERTGDERYVKQYLRTDDDGLPSLHGIVEVAGPGGPRQRDGSFEYYMSEPVVKNDFKGVGPFVLASLELSR